MSASNNRIREYETVHHLVSRVAHKVFVIGDEERCDLLDIVRRAAEFTGINLLGWCVMSNHFHLLVHLPQPPAELDETELMRRYQALKGKAARAAAEQQLANWRTSGDPQRADDWFNALRRRTYDIGSFMKIVKQWFTEDYNRRTGHVGTLWESAYHDRAVPLRVKDMSSVLGYIHLNPMRAALADCYDGYTWSSFSALAKGDRTALAGMRFVYDDEKATARELMEQHSLLLDKLLEGVKHQRAEEICRKRTAGFKMPVDHLTNEAMVAQAAAHINEVQNALVALHAEKATAKRRHEQRRDVTDEVFLAALSADPSASAESLASQLSITLPGVYYHLRKLKAAGVISRARRSDPWLISTAI